MCVSCGCWKQGEKAPAPSSTPEDSTKMPDYPTKISPLAKKGK